MLRLLDETTKRLLSGFVVERAGQYIPIDRVLYSTPERAFSGDDTKRIDLPVISFFMTTSEINTESDSFALLRRGGIVKDIATYTGFKSRLLPVRATYQVDFWVKFMDDARLLQTQLFHWFRLRVIPAVIDFGNGRGSQVWYFLDSISDNSDLEPGEDERLIRFTADIRAEGYLPMDEEAIKLIRDVIVHIDLL